MKIDKAKLEVQVDQVLEGVSAEEIAAELPPSAPRFVAYR